MSESFTEFTINDLKGHHMIVGDCSVLAVSSRHGLIYHKALPLDNMNKAEHSVNHNEIIVEVQGGVITNIQT